MSVRVRYAPSPTGLQHIGGIRTALFNYFFARSQGGTFILRVEDTDQERYSEESLQDLYDTFEWLGIHWDEGPDVGGSFGPYVQSQRFDLYRDYAQQLIDRGHAYRCYCTSERLDALREEQAKDKKSHQGYDYHCRDLSPEERAAREAAGLPSVVRFKVPPREDVVFQDELLGDVKRKSKDISPDPILIKSDGFPTYHLANVIDDHLMEITHIMRAQEWLPSGALHILLYRAFGWEPPKYCHLPMVMGKDGQKLSKRHGSTSVRDFRKEGYLPEALINYVSLVGWSYDDSREFFEKEDLEQLFSLEKINKAPGVFDYKKLQWFNGQYIRKRDDQSLKALLIPYLVADGVVSDPPTQGELELFDGAYPMLKERLKLLSEVSGLVRFLFQDIEEYQTELAVPKKTEPLDAYRALLAAAELLQGFENRSLEETEGLFQERADQMGMKLGQLMQPLRVSLTGTTVSPPLFESIQLLGVEKTVARINRLAALLREEYGE